MAISIKSWTCIIDSKCTFDNALVGVEVQGQHHVVLLDDAAGGLLDSLGTNATHGGKVFLIRVLKEKNEKKGVNVIVLLPGLLKEWQ